MWFRVRALCVLSFVSVFAGCSASNLAKDTQTSTETVQLLREQQVLLAVYTGHLEELLDAHYELNEKVDHLKSDLRGTDRRLYSEIASLKAETGISDKANADETEAPAQPQVSMSDQKLVLGLSEWVWFDLLATSLKARIDTGAVSSVIDVSNIQPFERDGEKWVRFSIPSTDEKVFESPVLRYTKTRQGADSVHRRPVVQVVVRLGDFYDDAEFVLVERESSMYPVLLGRSFLRDIAVVDVAKEFTQKKYSPQINTIAQP